MAVTEAPARSTAAGRTRRWGAFLMVLALLVSVGAVLGVVNPGRLVWVERLLHHPYPMLCASAVIFTVGFRLWSRRAVLRFVVGVVCLASAIGWASAWLLSPRDEGAVGTTPAPDRARYEAVVRPAGSDDSPAWRVSVRQTGSLLAREWPVGCVRQDEPAGEVQPVRWAAPDRLVVLLDDGFLAIEVDPADGRPERGTGPGWVRC